MSGSELPPAVSSLRSKFEQMAALSSSSNPSMSAGQKSRARSLSNTQKDHPITQSTSTVPGGQDMLAVPLLRSSPSSPDLKFIEKTKPTPPPSRGSRAPSPQLPSRDSPSPPRNSRASGSLYAKKPPPPPPEGKSKPFRSDVSADQYLREGATSLKSKFGENIHITAGNGHPSTTHAQVSNVRFASVSATSTLLSALPGAAGRRSPIKVHRSSFPPVSESSQTTMDDIKLLRCTSSVIGLSKENSSDPLLRQPPPIPSRYSEAQTSEDMQSELSKSLPHLTPCHTSSDSTSSTSSCSSEQACTLPPALPLRRMPPPLPERRNVSDESVNERFQLPRQRPSLDPLQSSPPSLAHSSPPTIPFASKPMKFGPPPPRRDLAIGAAASAADSPLTSFRNPPTTLPSNRHLNHIEPPPVRNLNSIPPPPVRMVGVNSKLNPVNRRKASDDDDSSSEEEEGNGQSPLLRTADLSRALIDELPDATHCSRRPPVSSSTLHRTAVPAPAGSVIAVAGYSVVVAHHNEFRTYDLSKGVVSGRAFLDIKSLGLDWKKEARITAVEFRGEDSDDNAGRFVWCGTRDGHLFEFDLWKLSMVRVRQAAHTHPVSRILRHGRSMLTLDENGKVLVWRDFEDLGQHPPRIVRTTDKQGFIRVFRELLWISPGSGNGHTVGGRGPAIRVYDILAPNCSVKTISTPEPLGAVTSGAVLSCQPGKIYLGHEGGYVSIWIDGPDTFDSGIPVPVCVHTQKIASSDILALEGVLDRIWTGSRGGIIAAYEVEAVGREVEDATRKPWRLTNAWHAHGDLPVSKLFIDPFSISKVQRLHVVSVGRDEQLRFWDGLLGVEWIESELQKREQEFSTFRPLNILVCSWNADAQKPDALTSGKSANVTFLKDVLMSVDRPDIIAFGFQELIDLESRSLTAKTVLLGGRKNADGSISDKISRSYRMWHDALVHAVRLAMPIDDPYVVAHTDNLVGLFSCIFVRQRQKALLRDSAMKTVKRGMGGRYGNKGAIVARFVFDDTSLCFINCHLAAGQSHSRQRNRDITAILEDGEALPPSEIPGALAYAGGGDGTMIMDHEIVFLNGDLNYRIDLRRDVIVKAIKEGDYTHILNHDQLRKQIDIHPGFRLRTFHEAPIAFAPTYKYDRRSEEYDTSEKRRAPAWCDRILWHCRHPDRVRSLHYRRYEVDVSDHRPISAAFTVTVKKHDSAAREAVKSQVQQQWKDREITLLFDMRKFYETHCIL